MRKIKLVYNPSVRTIMSLRSQGWKPVAHGGGLTKFVRITDEDKRTRTVPVLEGSDPT